MIKSRLRKVARMRAGKETAYYFEGSKRKSVRMPWRRNNIEKFDKALLSKLFLTWDSLPSSAFKNSIF